MLAALVALSGVALATLGSAPAFGVEAGLGVDAGLTDEGGLNAGADANAGVGDAAVGASADANVGTSDTIQADATVGVDTPVADADAGADVGAGPAGVNADVGAAASADPAAAAAAGAGVDTSPAPSALLPATGGIADTRPTAPQQAGASAPSAPSSGIADEDTSRTTPAGSVAIPGAGVAPAGSDGSAEGAAASLPNRAQELPTAAAADAASSASIDGLQNGSAGGAPPARVTAPSGMLGLGDMTLPAAIVVVLAAGIAATGAVTSLRGRPIPGAGMLSVAFAAIALSQVPDLFFGAPAADSWRARLEVALLAIPPWAIARQVRLLTRTPTRWLLVVDLSALTLVGFVLVAGGFPTTDVTSSTATFVTALLALVLFAATWISVRRMLRSSRRHDPSIARVRGTAMEWIVAAFLVVFLVWVTVPVASSAFLGSSIGMLVLSAMLTVVAVMPRPVSAALDRVGNRAMARSIETLVGSRDLQPVLASVMDEFADGLGVDGLAFVEHGRVIEFGGRCAMRRDRGPVADDELIEDVGSTRLVAWPNQLAPNLGRRRRERMRVAARLLQAACERDRLLAIERETIEIAAEAAAALADANETLRETNEIKGAFVSSVSHELRTPLTSIVGLARTAHDRWDDLEEDRLRDFQRIIAEQGERLTQLVSELLLIGRIEEGHLTVDVADVELAVAAEQAILDCGIDEGPIHVRQPSGSTRIRTDSMLLHEVLVNYLSNANKYGSPPIEVEFTRHGADLQIVVSDRGTPVPPEFRSKLFERFTRSREVTGKPGTGLGLAIVREISEKLGGDAWYEPHPDGGNCFCARFPVGWVEAASPDDVERAASELSGPDAASLRPRSNTASRIASN